MNNIEFVLRTMMVDYGKKLIEEGLVQGTWGNISTRLNDEIMLVTPSGVDYFNIEPEDMVKVNIKTLDFEPSKKPTTEKIMHGYIYRARPDIRAIIHTHSTQCSIFAGAQKELPVTKHEYIDILKGNIRVSKYAPAGTKRIAGNIVKALDIRQGVIMANHGMIGCGTDLAKAYEVCETMEAQGEEYISKRYDIYIKEVN